MKYLYCQTLGIYHFVPGTRKFQHKQINYLCHIGRILHLIAFDLNQLLIAFITVISMSILVVSHLCDVDEF